MHGKIPVTFQTDGVRDLVTFPNNKSYSLGSHSVVSVLTACGANADTIRTVIEGYDKQVPVTVLLDITNFFEATQPRRRKMGSSYTTMVLEDLKSNLRVSAWYVQHGRLVPSVVLGDILKQSGDVTEEQNYQYNFSSFIYSVTIDVKKFVCMKYDSDSFSVKESGSSNLFKNQNLTTEQLAKILTKYNLKTINQDRFMFAPEQRYDLWGPLKPVDFSVDGTSWVSKSSYTLICARVINSSYGEIRSLSDKDIIDILNKQGIRALVRSGKHIQQAIEKKHDDLLMNYLYEY